MTPATLSVRLVVDQLCAKVPGGTAWYAGELLRALAGSTPSSAQLTAVAGRRCHALADLPVTVDLLHLPGPLLARLWERGLPPTPPAADVVHAPTLMLPPRSSRYRLVVTIHDVVPWTHPDTLTKRGVAFHRRMGERAARDAALVLTPTHAVAREVRRLLSPAAPVVAVHHGATVRPAPEDADARRARLGVGSGYLLFVGTAEPRKGLDVLVAALARPELAGRRLVVAGPSGWGEVDVRDLARQAGVSDRVLVTGRLSDQDLAAVYAGSRALAMPSRAEGFGLPVVEAMALRVPVVTTDDPALVEVGGGAAVVVTVGDVDALAKALSRVCEQGGDRSALVQQGMRRAAAFDWSATAERLWTAYSDVASMPCQPLRFSRGPGSRREPDGPSVPR
ncbi:MAG: glycosyltransferase family 4 protein [Dermatophilaceae bacterium]